MGWRVGRRSRCRGGTPVQSPRAKCAGQTRERSMSSIQTNTSAMVALQALKGINSGMNKTQQEIATGKSIATAKDNATVWITLALDE